MPDEQWKKTVEDGLALLIKIYQRTADLGHGELTVKFNKENDRVEIDAGQKFRSSEEFDRFIK